MIGAILLLLAGAPPQTGGTVQQAPPAGSQSPRIGARVGGRLETRLDTRLTPDRIRNADTALRPIDTLRETNRDTGLEQPR